MSLLDKLLCVTATVFILAGVVCLSVLEGERSNPNLPGLILLVLGIFTWLPLLITGFKVGGGGGGGSLVFKESDEKSRFKESGERLRGLHRAKVNQSTVRRNRIFKYLCLVAGLLILGGLGLGPFIQDDAVLASLIVGGFFFFAFSFIWWIGPKGGGGGGGGCGGDGGGGGGGCGGGGE